jgi:hypothetical protein
VSKHLDKTGQELLKHKLDSPRTYPSGASKSTFIQLSLLLLLLLFPQCINNKQTMSVAKSSTPAVEAEKVAFIEAALKNGVLLFGEFTLKSGR